MIERNIIEQKAREFMIKSYLTNRLRGAQISSVQLRKIPLGEKVFIRAGRPSVVVGSKGSTIRKITSELKQEFGLENPQIEIEEVKDAMLDAQIVADRIKSSLERFGSARFKGSGHRTLQWVLQAGALGGEILLSGKIPGSRAKRWRFYRGYLKKSGDISIEGVRTAYASAHLKTGTIGIQVRIMPPGLALPDHVELLDLEAAPVQVEEVKDIEEAPAKKAEEAPAKKTAKKAPAKKAAKKAPAKKAEPKAEEEAKAPAQEAVEEAPAQEAEAPEVKGDEQ